MPKDIPKKYVKVDGKMVLNPDYKAYMDAQKNKKENAASVSASVPVAHAEAVDDDDLSDDESVGKFDGLVLEHYEDSDWADLPKKVKRHAKGIGYTKKLWTKDKDPKTFEMDWKELNDFQKKSARFLGYNRVSWDDDDSNSSSSSSSSSSSGSSSGSSSSSSSSSSSGSDSGHGSNNSLVLDHYEDYDWTELPQWVRKNAKGIGYNRKIWNKDKEPKSFDLDWEDLDGAQKKAAKRLGYNSASWESDSDSDDY